MFSNYSISASWHQSQSNSIYHTAVDKGYNTVEHSIILQVLSKNGHSNERILIFLAIIIFPFLPLVPVSW